MADADAAHDETRYGWFQDYRCHSGCVRSRAGEWMPDSQTPARGPTQPGESDPLGNISRESSHVSGLLIGCQEAAPAASLYRSVERSSQQWTESCPANAVGCCQIIHVSWCSWQLKASKFQMFGTQQTRKKPISINFLIKRTHFGFSPTTWTAVARPRL